MARIGFVVNPIAGMGGRVGLKGTDGKVDEAVRLGASRLAPGRASEFLTVLALRMSGNDGLKTPEDRLTILTVSGPMGGDALGVVPEPPWNHEIVMDTKESTTGEDTKAACVEFRKRGATLIVFCGGDGTARDVCDAVGTTIPVLGVPAGVKMHSAVFGTDPASAALTALGFLNGEKPPTEAEVIDLDEEAYRSGEWWLRIHGSVMVPFDPNFVQTGKEMFESEGDDEVKAALAEHVWELSNEEEKGTLMLLGPGSTMMAVKRRLGFEGTLLGVDAYEGGRGPIASDLNETAIRELLSKHARRMILVSPIGAQGFVLGRGNLQLSPDVVRAVGIGNLLVLSTPSKLSSTPRLRVDTGDHSLDDEFQQAKYLWVVVGYRLTRLVRLSFE